MKPRVMILGIDGYIGYSLCCYLASMGRYIVYGIDDLSRRLKVHKMGSDSAIPIKHFHERFLGIPNLGSIKQTSLLHFSSPSPFEQMLKEIKPEVIIHLAEMPSAAYSMASKWNSLETVQHNVAGTLRLLWSMIEYCPDAHLIKLGTMGEYGTPPCPIPEGFFPSDSMYYPSESAEGYSLDGCLFPRRAGSWYHLSKVHDTYNVRFACDNYGLRSTDIMQGIVYGTQCGSVFDESHPTRFDFDECFGTVLNRFCAQVVADYPITPYGSGNQTRGFLPLCDVMQCLRIAIDNPPYKGQYRTWNQFDSVYSVNDLADIVFNAAQHLGLRPAIERIPNPRKEQEEHMYQVDTSILRNLGYEPVGDIELTVTKMIQDLLPHKDRILRNAGAIYPLTKW